MTTDEPVCLKDVTCINSSKVHEHLPTCLIVMRDVRMAALNKIIAEIEEETDTWTDWVFEYNDPLMQFLGLTREDVVAEFEKRRQK